MITLRIRTPQRTIRIQVPADATPAQIHASAQTAAGLSNFSLTRDPRGSTKLAGSLIEHGDMLYMQVATVSPQDTAVFNNNSDGSAKASNLKRVAGYEASEPTTSRLEAAVERPQSVLGHQNDVWSCEACTYFNPLSQSLCLICDTKRRSVNKIFPV
jgi:hypothetical protein